MRSLREVSIPQRVLAVALLALVSAVLGCAPEESGACRTSRECSGGRVCVEHRCVRMEGPSDAGLLPTVLDAASSMLTPRPDAGPCLEVSSESSLEPVPIDIIVTIDNSGSMTAEASEVQRNINMFATILGASGLDYRIVLISASAEDDDQGVCVPAPLGSGAPACTGGAEGRLLALHVGVGSSNAPDRVIEQYPMYRSFLRDGAAKIFVWITDDESSRYTADSFRSAMTALDPTFGSAIHNAIVGFYGDAPADWGRGGAGACASLADVGFTYLRLAECLTDRGEPVADCTIGRRARVCETDWTPVFVDIARGVIEGVPARCELEVPAPPTGMAIDPDGVSVAYHTTGGVLAAELTRVESEAACVAGGWFFDDAAAPSTITLCPDACRTVQSDDDARVEVSLGCFVPLM